MMKQLFTFLLILFIFNITFAQTPLKLIEKHGQEFPKYTELAIAIIDGDKVTYHGFIKKEKGFEPKTNEQAIFEIGSITKVFTSTILADQVIKGKIKLNELIKKSLDFKLKGNPKITFQSLANHSSGLPSLPDNIFPIMVNNPDNPYKGYTANKLKEYCTKQLDLKKAVGEQYDYSNLGAGLLGYALSQKNNKSYEELLQEIVFKPLKMKQTTTDRSLVKEQLVKGLDPSGSVTSNWDLDVLAPAGNVLSSVSDLSKFIIANFDANNKVFALQQTKTNHVRGNMDIALGWHIINNADEVKCHWHNGGTGGYTSSMTINVKDKMGVVILSNVSAFHPKMGNIDALGFELMKELNSSKEK